MGCYLAVINACQSHAEWGSETSSPDGCITPSSELSAHRCILLQLAACLPSALWGISQDTSASPALLFIREAFPLKKTPTTQTKKRAQAKPKLPINPLQILQQVRLEGICGGDLIQPSKSKANFKFTSHCSEPCPVKYWLSPRTEISQNLATKHLAGMWFMWMTQGILFSLIKCSLTASYSVGIIRGFLFFWTKLS